MLKRPFWVLMAVLCIVFSSASKRLIEQKLAPYFTSSEALGKKVKDGSRDKREFFKSTVQSEKQSPDNPGLDFSFPLATLIAVALIFLSGKDFSPTRYSRLPQLVAPLPLYLQIRKLQV